MRSSPSKSVWGMSRRSEAMKGVADCEKLREAVEQALILRFPNEHILNP